jgi:glycosyltransferase involved in cell wall biosynthesis
VGRVTGSPSTLYGRMVRRARRRASRYARHLLERPADGLVHSQANPTTPDVLDHFRFFAVLGTWMEEDVVDATVRNALAQGAEAVYLVDNASTDATVERAVAAGATLAESFDTDAYEERVRILLMNGVVARMSLASGAEHVWWLWLDADEFPEGPDGMTIADYLAGLDRRFRVVGTTYYNHFPTDEPHYISGFHPLDFQPMAERYLPERPRHCSLPHWKHPLQRFDRHGPFLLANGGFHSATLRTKDRLLEPTGGIVTHHVQYREEAATRARMDRLCAGAGRNDFNDSIGNTEIRQRLLSLDAVYAQRFGDIDNLLTKHSGRGVHPVAWSGRPSARWYSPADLDEARRAWSGRPAADDRPSPSVR